MKKCAFDSSMSERVTSYAPYILMLYSADSRQRKSLLKSMTWKQQRALYEVILNVYKGTFPLSKYYLKRLLPYRNAIHKLSSGKVKKSDKRRILLKNHLMLPIVIKPALKVLKNVSRVDTDTAGKI